MKKETLLIVVIALVVGALVGLLISQGSKKREPAGGGAPMAAVPTGEVVKNVQLLEKLVATEPGNRNAWVELGHLYFDSDQHMKAVAAYDKALELNPNDANVLTDQGVMFRRLGWYDRAVQNFTRASQVDPRHIQSLFNLGIVYRYDLLDAPAAREAWTKYLALSPTGRGADQVRAELQVLESVVPAPVGQ